MFNVSLVVGVVVYVIVFPVALVTSSSLIVNIIVPSAVFVAFATVADIDTVADRLADN